MSLIVHSNVLWAKDPGISLPEKLGEAIRRRPFTLEILETGSYRDGFDKIESGVFSGLMTTLNLEGNKPTKETKLGVLLALNARERENQMPVLLVGPRVLQTVAEGYLGPADTWPEQGIWFLDTLATQWPELEAFFKACTP